MRRSAFLALALVAAFACSCAKDHKNLPASFAYVPPATPSHLTVTAGVERATLRWSYSPAALGPLRGFDVYVYEPTYQLLQLIGTTKDTTFVDSLLVGNLVYCYEVSAVDTSGLEGYRTPHVCAFVRTPAALSARR